jgi:hypothetical protein
MQEALDAGRPPQEVLAAESLQGLGRMRHWETADAARRGDELVRAIEAELAR